MPFKKVCIFLFFIVLMSSCAVVKPHEMVYLNDSEMQMGAGSDKSFSIYVESIREGSGSTGNGKASGGCGCN